VKFTLHRNGTFNIRLKEATAHICGPVKGDPLTRTCHYQVSLSVIGNDRVLERNRDMILRNEEVQEYFEHRFAGADMTCERIAHQALIDLHQMLKECGWEVKHIVVKVSGLPKSAWLQVEKEWWG
jgi:hypothetical protein